MPPEIKLSVGTAEFVLAVLLVLAITLCAYEIARVACVVERVYPALDGGEHE